MEAITFKTTVKDNKIELPGHDKFMGKEVIVSISEIQDDIPVVRKWEYMIM